MVIGESKITIVQGDSYERYITIDGISLDLIEGIYFSSDKLNISKKLILKSNVFVLSLTSEETKDLPVVNTNYDLTIKFNNNKINTIQYQATISILKKNNKVETW